MFATENCSGICLYSAIDTDIVLFSAEAPGVRG